MGNPGRTRKTTGKPEEACGRYRSSSVHPDRFTPLVESGLEVRIFCFSLGRVLPRRDCSCGSRSVPSRSFCSSTHHIVFARQPITMFLNDTHHEVLDCIAACAVRRLHLGDACGADCGAAASFKIFVLLFTLAFFKFVLCDVGYFFVAQSHSVDVSR